MVSLVRLAGVWSSVRNARALFRRGDEVLTRVCGRVGRRAFRGSSKPSVDLSETGVL
jgi:hypothetical protein